MRPKYRDLEERLFYNSVDINGHWLWLGKLVGGGYGRMNIWVPRENRMVSVLAHRVSYELFIGPIPPGHDLDHCRACKQRACIHPNHLTPRPWREHRRETLYRGSHPPNQLVLTP